MLKSNIIKFIVEKRDDIEYVLKCRFGCCEPWVMIKYEGNPCKDILKRDIEIILRSFEIYHRHLEIPRFYIKDIDNIINSLLRID